jgi:hypothetical protein
MKVLLIDNKNKNPNNEGITHKKMEKKPTTTLLGR